MQKIWGIVLSAFSLLFGAFLWQKNKRQDAEAKLENSETKKNDAVLAQHSEDIKNQIQKDKEETEANKKDNSDSNLLDFLNKKNK